MGSTKKKATATRAWRASSTRPAAVADGEQSSGGMGRPASLGRERERGGCRRRRGSLAHVPATAFGRLPALTTASTRKGCRPPPIPETPWSPAATRDPAA